MVIIVMGVSGAGKTTIGRILAERLGWKFLEGDTFHSKANVAKMHSGIPLNDEDRWPWLAAIREEITRYLKAGEDAIIACSALKASYRKVLRGSDGDAVQVLYLRGTQEEIAERVASRTHHFMPPSLLGSQFEALEEPEDAVTVEIGGTPDQVVDRVLQVLKIPATGTG